MPTQQSTQRPRTRGRAGLVLLCTALLLTTAALVAVASPRFDDVGPEHTHSDGINYAKEADITAGCGDGSIFCPGHPVTRGQLSTFLYRASGNDPATEPSVNAATLQGLSPQQLRGRQPRTSHIVLQGVGVGAVLIGNDWEPACGRDPARLCAIPVNGDAFLEGTETVVDYRFRVNEQGEGCLRVWNLTKQEPVAGSEVCRAEQGSYFIQVPIELAAGSNEYVLERKGESEDSKVGSVSQVHIISEHIPE